MGSIMSRLYSSSLLVLSLLTGCADICKKENGLERRVDTIKGEVKKFIKYPKEKIEIINGQEYRVCGEIKVNGKTIKIINSGFIDPETGKRVYERKSY